VTQKTNAARLLDRMGIRYQLLECEADPEDLAAAVQLPSRVTVPSLVSMRPVTDLLGPGFFWVVLS
jgi:hypothetical protein